MRAYIAAAMLAFELTLMPPAFGAGGAPTGTDLLDYCTPDDPFSKGMCNGLIVGAILGLKAGYERGVDQAAAAVAANQAGPDKPADAPDQVGTIRDLLEQRGENAPFCLPGNVSNKQIRDALVKWLNANPDKRKGELPQVVNQALNDLYGYPCTVDPR